MTLIAAYREDYRGEVISDSKHRYLIRPKDVFHRNGGKAVVLGNGTSRQNDMLVTMLNANRSRPLNGYKIVYACNGAAQDLDADHFVVNNRKLMGHISSDLWHQLFVPWDMYLDYPDTNMIPLINGMDAGSIATYLACFDGNTEIFLFGFDRQTVGNNNCYAGRPCYDDADTSIDSSLWDDNLLSIMQAYKDVKFYRVGAGRSPASWLALHNFYDIRYKDAVFLGDF